MVVYRRHKNSCPHKHDRISKQCRCPLWAKGIVEGKPYQKSLKTRNFGRAEKRAREIQDGETPALKITVKHALDAFIKDCEARNLNTSTLNKYRRLRALFLQFCASRGLLALTECTSDLVREFRMSWTLSPRTASKQIERLRAFFKFSVENGWLAKNPASVLKAPTVKALPRLPFSNNDIQQIIAQTRDDRELAFVLVLRHTGLRIGDASLLSISHFDGERIHLYTTKAGIPVSIRIPPDLASLLKRLTPRGGYFFLRGESTAMHTTADLWRRSIKRMCKAAKVVPDHPHRFRHSLAADLLMKGASVEDVAAILGNSPAIVIKHYSQWIRGRQERLDAFLEQTWQPKLVRVK